MATTCSFQTLGLRASAPVRPTRAARRSLVVRAETETTTTTTTEAPVASVGAEGSKKALGFFEEDSAGQTNIFAVETKAYVAGSAQDNTDSTPTLLFAGIGGAIAIAAIAAGIIGGKNAAENAIPVYEDAGKYESLTTYAAKFSTKSAPQL